MLYRACSWLSFLVGSREPFWVPGIETYLAPWKASVTPVLSLQPHSPILVSQQRQRRDRGPALVSLVLLFLGDTRNLEPLDCVTRRQGDLSGRTQSPDAFPVPPSTAWVGNSSQTVLIDSSSPLVSAAATALLDVGHPLS